MTANPFAALLDGVQRYGYVYNNENCEWELTTLRDDGQYVCYADVLAALAAAVPDDLAEAGKVLEGVTPGPWEEVTPADGLWPPRVFSGSTMIGMVDNSDMPHAEKVSNARFIAWCREGVPALLARIAAQEAQIKGLKAERDEAVSKAKKNAKIAAKAYTIITLASDDLQDEGDRVYLGSTNTADILRDAREEWAAHRIIGDSALTLVEENWVLKARAEAAEAALAAERARSAKLVEALKPFADIGIGTDPDYQPMIRMDREAIITARAAITEASQ